MYSNNWISQTVTSATSSVITLGAVASSDLFKVGEVVGDGLQRLFMAVDGDDRMSFIGTYTVAGDTIAIDKALETKVGTVYDGTNPTALTLSSSAIVTVGTSSQKQSPVWGYDVPSPQTGYGSGDSAAAGFGATTATLTAGTLYVAQFELKAMHTVIGSIAIEVKTAAPAGNDMRVGICEIDPVSGLCTMLEQTADILVDTTGAISTSITALPLTSGIYGSVFFCEGSTGVGGVTQGDLSSTIFGSRGTGGTLRSRIFGKKTETWAAIPSTFTPTSYDDLGTTPSAMWEPS